jgi:hypothetical protein
MVTPTAANRHALRAEPQQVGQDVAGVGDLIQDGRVYGAGLGGGEGGELGFGGGALGMQLSPGRETVTRTLRFRSLSADRLFQL